MLPLSLLLFSALSVLLIGLFSSAKPLLIHLRGTALSSVNLECALLTSHFACVSVFLRSMQGGQRSEVTHLFIAED